MINTNKAFDTGMVVGRFQTFHKGHQRLVETALNLCDRVLILVGSSQECGTERNPLSVATRMEMIRAVYPDTERVIIYPLADLTHEDDITTDWGRYVLSNADRYIYKAPELMVYGNDEARSRWFDTEDIKDTSEFIINRGALPISATMLRGLMVADNRKEWMTHVNPRLHKHYDRIRAELMTMPFYQDMHKKLVAESAEPEEER